MLHGTLKALLDLQGPHILTNLYLQPPACSLAPDPLWLADLDYTKPRTC